jgi:hypothetical protein
MLARNDLVEYLLDHHGLCDRDRPDRNDCYWGKDAAGRENGCLKVGWLGRGCKHWRPIGGTNLDYILRASAPIRSGTGNEGDGE